LVANFHPHDFLLPFSSGGCLSAERMNQMDDWQLLREYATRNSEEAFRALVDRYAGLVYHAALRQAGNPHTAEEVTQAVFIALAQKADRIPRGIILSGWLFRATRFAFSNLAREQSRRQRREQEAAIMETILRPDETASVWEQIVPHLNDALDRLPRKDREAVLVRFFQDKSHRELARTLGVSEDAAKVRVSRALEKLRLIFARRGYAVPSAVLLATISAHGAQAAPAGLTASVASVAVAKGTAGTTSTLTLAKGVLKIMAWTKAKTAIVSGVVVLLAAGTPIVLVTAHRAHTQPRPDRNPPKIITLKVSPSTTTLGRGFTVSYMVSDSGGSHLNGVELWRAHINGTGNDGTWTQIGATVSLSGDGPVSGAFPEDIPEEPGNYWYGIHVTDHAGNIIYEDQAGFRPIRVTVIR
jgi:RNA polymerase sigma factor (sigma-70 family)